MTLFDRHACFVLASSFLAAGCPSRTNTPATDATDATDAEAGETDTNIDHVAQSCLGEGTGGEPFRWECLLGLSARCADATSEDDCVGQWSAAELDILGPLEVACRWHPEAMLVRVLYDADATACEVLERSPRCLGVVLTNDPEDPVGDPRCDPFGPLTCEGGVQSGRPYGATVSNTDAWLVKPVECGAILGFDETLCQIDDFPAPACGCFCE